MKTYKAPLPPLQEHQRIVYGATVKFRIKELYSVANQCKDVEFIIPYMATTTGIPGVDNIEQLAGWFATFYRERSNLVFEESFAELIKAELEKQGNNKPL